MPDRVPGGGAAFAVLLLAWPALAEDPPVAELADPTKPDLTAPAAETTTGGKGPINLGALQVNLILQGRERNLALINGKRYKEGDRLGPAVVKKIEDNGVILAVDEVEQLVRRDSCFRLDEREGQRGVVQTATCGSGEASNIIRLRKEGRKFLVDGLLNGKESVAFILDTGATHTSLPRDIIARVVDGETFKKLRDDGLPHIPIRLADGGTAEAHVLTLDSLKLGEVVLKKVMVLVQDADGAPALLGVNVLDQLRAQIDTHRGLLILGR